MLKFHFYLLIGLSFCVSSYAQSVTKTKQDKLAQHQQGMIEELKEVTTKYSSSHLHSKFKKKQILSLLGEVEESKGQLYYSKKRLRLEMNKPQEIMVLVTPTVVWNVTYEGSKVESIVKSKPISTPLLDLLFGSAKVWEQFKIETVHKSGERKLDVSLVPRDKNKVASVSRVRLEIDKFKDLVKELTYWDDVGNEVEMDFYQNKFKKSLPNSKFQYTPPKGAKVSNL